MKFPPPRKTFFKEPKPSSQRVQFMIPETEGEWPLVHQPDGKRWRTTSAYKHAKSVLKKSKAPKPLESLAKDYNIDDENEGDDDNAAVVKDDFENEESSTEELYEKLRHYFHWASSAHRAMHEGFPYIIKVRIFYFHDIQIL